MKRDKVVLVNQEDLALGVMDKMEAHVEGKLHRAFSIFIFNTQGEMLIHQRADHKYHGGGLWTNACCSHPQFGEDILQGANERLQFEMGLKCDMKKVFSFIYNTPVENNLIEHELDHVLLGVTDENPLPNPDEVQDFRWVYPMELLKEVTDRPDKFTFWFRTALPEVLDGLRLEISNKYHT